MPSGTKFHMLQLIHAFTHPFLIKSLKTIFQNFIPIKSALLQGGFFLTKQTGENMTHFFLIYPQLQDLVYQSLDCLPQLRSQLIELPSI